MRRVVRIAGAILLAAYPIAIWAGISLADSRVAGLIVLAALAIVLPLRVRSGSRELLGSGIALAVLALTSILLNDPRLLLAMPVLVNITLLFGFGTSLLGDRMPAVERFARMTDPNLSPRRVLYCRQVTKVWCLFFLVNAAISLWLALYAPLAVWGLYSGGIAYLLMGLLFAGEYAIRKIRLG